MYRRPVRLHHRLALLALLPLALFLGGCPSDSPGDGAGFDTTAAPPTRPAVPVYSYDVVNTWAHDTSAFTQGLLFHDGFLYESTGLEGESSLRKVDVETGKVVKRIDLPAEVFAEGLTLVGDHLYQISWRNNRGWVYDLESFRQLRSFEYRGEGWGLATDDSLIYMSDGTSIIRVLSPDSLTEIRRIMVTEGDQPVQHLNELEWVEGEIYANVWQTDRIVRIDPATGRVTGYIDLTNLLPPQDRQPQVDVLNGIAYDEQTKRLWVTGKKWPRLFEIRVRRISV